MKKEESIAVFELDGQHYGVRIHKGYSSIVFSNVTLPEHIEKHKNNLGYLVTYVKQGVETKSQLEDENYNDFIPIMKYLHNEGILYFDYDLACFYLGGTGVKKNYHVTFKLLKEVASAYPNDALIMQHLGNCYQYGIGTKINLKEAKRWHKKAADKIAERKPTFRCGLYRTLDL